MLEGLNGATDLYPIFGDPIAAVQSPRTLTGGFAARGVNAICVPMLVPKDALEPVVAGLSATHNVRGLLITMPHKQTTFDLCATASEQSRRLGVVSVARRNSDGSWHGDMLDGTAFVKAQVDQGAKPEGARVLLVGAGAAGSAIALALLDAGVEELIISDLDEARVSALVKNLHEWGYANVRAGSSDPTGCDMVCNASPAGMKKGDASPVPVDKLAPSMFVGDVVAGHGATPLLQAAQDVGCRTANGNQMVDAVREIMLDFMLEK